MSSLLDPCPHFWIHLPGFTLTLIMSGLEHVRRDMRDICCHVWFNSILYITNSLTSYNSNHESTISLQAGATWSFPYHRVERWILRRNDWEIITITSFTVLTSKPRKPRLITVAFSTGHKVISSHSSSRRLVKNALRTSRFLAIFNRT